MESDLINLENSNRKFKISIFMIFWILNLNNHMVN